MTYIQNLTDEQQLRLWRYFWSFVVDEGAWSVLQPIIDAMVARRKGITGC